MTTIIDAVQQSVLDEVLTRNSQIEHLSDRLTFKPNIRIVTYEDIQVKIQHKKYDPDPFFNHFSLAIFESLPNKLKNQQLMNT
ncbi:hypothetical protein MTR67_025876 [Solanum verrucosum]|uniref:Uncharacterized protein n=1 Tax=Solanum verrucosum TaxID=315347 RepID=A0AAF0QZI0_SOLVR|nr:hypothetical protein MTR67_025876 [Solanum verrucosum]